MNEVIKQDALDVFQTVNGMNKYWLALNCNKQLISNELSNCLKIKSISCRIQNPWIVIWTFHTSVKTDGFTWELPCSQWTCIW